MLDAPAALNRSVAIRLLDAGDTDALSSLLSVIAIIGDDFLDEDGQPMEETELHEMLDADGVKAHPDNLVRVVGLLNAICGDEFTEDPVHFARMAAAICEGDPFCYEDDEEIPPLPELYWAIYLAGLVSEEDLVPLLSDRVGRYLSTVADEEAEDWEGLAAAIKERGEDPAELKPYMECVLVFRRAVLAHNLHELGCKPEWIADLDPDLATGLAENLEA